MLSKLHFMLRYISLINLNFTEASHKYIYFTWIGNIAPVSLSDVYPEN